MSQLNKPNKALVMAGGTGGHIFPGLAVAKALQEKSWQTAWLGSKGGMEERLVNDDSIQLNLISVSGLRGKGLAGWLKMPFTLTRAVREAIAVIKLEQPDVVIGFGGFASGPGGLAAWLCRKPLVIHEQNAIAGMTNKVLSKFATKVFQAFPAAFPANKKVETVGNPVRQAIAALNSLPVTEKSDRQQINILVVGGSRGALALNKFLPGVFAELLQAQTIAVLHQVGKGRVEETEDFYRGAGIEFTQSLKLTEFIDDMAEAFRWADLLVCRAGASTVSEVSVAGRCAIFVPYPYAVDDHQTANANWLVDKQAALCLQETEIDSDTFKAQVKGLVSNPKKIYQIAQSAKDMAYLDAANCMADYCEQMRNQAA